MGVILYYLVLALLVGCGCLFIWDKFIHPMIFQEELEDTLEDAVEGKLKKEVQKKAEEILEGDDAV